jgi:hypothetical protein
MLGDEGAGDTAANDRDIATQVGFESRANRALPKRVPRPVTVTQVNMARGAWIKHPETLSRRLDSIGHRVDKKVALMPVTQRWSFDGIHAQFGC